MPKKFLTIIVTVDDDNEIVSISTTEPKLYPGLAGQFWEFYNCSYQFPYGEFHGYREFIARLNSTATSDGYKVEIKNNTKKLLCL